MFVALLCIAFGVMSLVAMTLVSQSFDRAMVLKPSEQIGADLSLGAPTEDTISPEQVEELSALAESGEIQRFTLMAYTSSLTFHRPVPEKCISSPPEWALNRAYTRWPGR